MKLTKAIENRGGHKLSSLLVAIAAGVVLPFAADAEETTFYICETSGNNDPWGCSSIDGVATATAFPRGWSTTQGGARTELGITSPDGIYRIWLSDCWVYSPTNGSYATPATSRIIVESGKLWGVANGLSSGATLTLNNVTLESRATFAWSELSWVKPLSATVDGSFALADGSCLQYRGRNNTTDFRLAATVSGTGKIEMYGVTDAKVGRLDPSITGDLSGFKGDLVVYSMSTNGMYNAVTNGMATTFAVELAGATSIPADPDPGSTARVVVKDGAMLMIDHDWNSPESRAWDFGDGLTPTICVAEGKTVTINGEIFGSAGFNKAGPGSLVLKKAPNSVSGFGLCNILAGKVRLEEGAHAVAHLFRRKDSLTLPAGYTMLESLSLAGGAQNSYIDTGSTPTNGFYGFVFDYRLDGTVGPSGGRLMGTSLYHGGGWGGLVFSSWANDATVHSGQFGFGDKYDMPVAGGQVANARMRMSFMNGNAELSCGWRQRVGVATPSRFNGSVYLGNFHCDSMANGQPTTIYRFMVFDGCTLLHDFVPVKNASGVAGVYDTVGNLGFRSAANAQHCTAGAVYDATTDNQWLEDDPAARIVVTNGTTLVLADDLEFPEGRAWDFGDGLTPTIYVAEGKTVTINGALFGSSGFNKAGPGTLVLTKASRGFSGLCNVLAGKVCLMKGARELAGLFRRREAIQLPPGYTKLESVSLAGGANDSYIDTGYTPTNGFFGCVFDYRLDGTVGSSGGRLMGTSYYNAGKWGGLVLSSWAGSASSSGQFGFGAVSILPATGGQAANTRMRLSLMNGNAELSRGWRQNVGTATPPRFYGSIYLGNFHCDSMSKGQPVTVYRFTVFDGCTLLHDFVPVKNANGVAGVYDTVGNLGFRSAANVQHCTAGAVFEKGMDEQWLEIESGGVTIIFR